MPKITITVAVEPETLERINELVPTGQRAGWIRRAIHDRLEGIEDLERYITEEEKRRQRLIQMAEDSLTRGGH